MYVYVYMYIFIYSVVNETQKHTYGLKITVEWKRKCADKPNAKPV